MVTLCKGQGGTPADNPLRSWHDSWQVVAMAAQSGFCLARVDRFDATRFPEYHSVGFRLVFVGHADNSHSKRSLSSSYLL